MKDKDEELERKNFIEENPDTMELFDKIINKIFGKKENNKDNEPIE